MTLLLQVDDLVKHYRLPREHLLSRPALVPALQGVSFALHAGRSLGVVGESGSGKSTLARLVMALEPPTAGTVRLGGQDLQALDAAGLRRARADFQMVFQDPFGSLDPRQTVGHIVAEPLAAQGGQSWFSAQGGQSWFSAQGGQSWFSAQGGPSWFSAQASLSRGEQQARVGAMLDAVGLRAADAGKYPHEFSGGQRQRIAIARALVTNPKLIVADEPVSALDVSVQAQVLNLMQDLQDRLGVTYLFISHDLAVVDLVCDEVLMLYQGRVVEQGSPQALFNAAAHPYTRAMMDAVPGVRPGTRRAPRRLVQPLTEADAATGGCAYAPRCALRQADCLTSAPALRAVAAGHQAACHLAEQVLSGGAANTAESSAS